MNYLDLFHGIGGFAYGAYLAGMKFENHLCSDIELYCQKLYKLRFPDSIQLGNIKKIDTQELINKYGKEWIITGGFPCQDISIAGKGAGITGSRSGLWFEYWRIIRDLRPRFAIMENVAALTFRGLDAVLGSLSEIGYNAEWQDIRASDVGAPHRRARIWIVAHPDNYSNWEQIGRRDGTENKKEISNRENNDSTGDIIRTNNLRVFGKRRKTKNVSYSQSMSGRNNSRLGVGGVDRGKRTGQEDVADSGCEHGHTRDATGMEADKEQRTYSKLYIESGSTGQLSDTPISRLERQESTGNGRRESRLSSQHSGWDVEPSICRMADGVSAGMDGYEGRVTIKSYEKVNRLKGLGNSIVPQIAEILFNQIKSHISPPSSQ